MQAPQPIQYSLITFGKFLNLDGFSTENLQQVAFTKDEQEYFVDLFFRNPNCSLARS